MPSSSTNFFTASQPFASRTSPERDSEAWQALANALPYVGTGTDSVVIVTKTTDKGEPGDFAWAAKVLSVTSGSGSKGLENEKYGLGSELSFRDKSTPSWSTETPGRVWYFVEHATHPYRQAHKQRWVVPSDPELFIDIAAPTDDQTSATEVIAHVLEAVSKATVHSGATDRQDAALQVVEAYTAELDDFKAIFEQAGRTLGPAMSQRASLVDVVAMILAHGQCQAPA